MQPYPAATPPPHPNCPFPCQRVAANLLRSALRGTLDFSVCSLPCSLNQSRSDVRNSAFKTSLKPPGALAWGFGWLGHSV